MMISQRFCCVTESYQTILCTRRTISKGRPLHWKFALLMLMLGLGLTSAPDTSMAGCDETIPQAEARFEFRMSDFLPDDVPNVSKRVYRVKFSPDGQTIAIRDGSNFLWTYNLLEKNFKQAEMPKTDQKRIEDLAYSADGQLLYGICDGGPNSLLCWNAEDLSLRWINDVAAGKTLTLAPTGQLLVNGRELIDVEHAQETPRLRRRAGLIQSWEGTVSLLLTNLSNSEKSRLEWRDRFDETSTKTVLSPQLPMLWQGILQREVGRAVGRQGVVSEALQLLPDGNRVLLRGHRGLLLWDVPSADAWSELGTTDKPLDRGYFPITGDILTIRLSPNGQWIVVGTVGKTTPERIPGEVHLIDAVSGRWIGMVTTTTQSASALDFSNDSRWLVVGSLSMVDDYIRVFDLEAWLNRVVSSRRNLQDNLPGNRLIVKDHWTHLHRVHAIQANPNLWQDEVTRLLSHDYTTTQQVLLSIVQELNGPNFQVRERAEEQLRMVAVQYPVAMREILDDPDITSEMRFRLQRVANQATTAVRLPTASWHEFSYTLYALERIEEAWAGELLQESQKHPVRAVARQALISHHSWLARQQNRLNQLPIAPLDKPE